MAITKVGSTAIEVLGYDEFCHIDTIAYGDCGILDRIAHETWVNWRSYHPLTRHQKVLNALDRDERFEKFYFRASVGRGEQRMRGFILKRTEEVRT